jgi:osmoprotectant transport system permease protein
MDQLRAALRERGLGMSEPLGFNDGYAIAVTKEVGARAISDLARRPELRFALTHEFRGRADGWPGLAAHYGLAPREVVGMSHELAFEALAAKKAEATDGYTTDAQLDALGLVVLEDDRGFFPRYDAVVLYRLDLEKRAPRAFAAIAALRVSEPTMRRANGALVLEKKPLAEAVSIVTGAVAKSPPPSRASEITRATLEHLKLVALSLFAAIFAGVPLGIAASRSRALAGALLGLTGVLQTIPSLALLALLIPLLGIGATPAVVALFLYGLLPIVRGTLTGLRAIPPQLADAAAALPLSPLARLRRIELPLASPHVLAGIKTSAVINVGTATIAALVGAEGLGQPILQGIALRDTARILEGAVPAALLALLVQGAFDLMERVIVPRGLRLSPAR